jgi:hypothetical protein
MSRIVVPSTGPEDWRNLLPDPDKQWKIGSATYELANAWETADGFPASVARVLETVPSLAGIEPLIVQPAQGAESLADSWVLATCDKGLVSISVAGKVDEAYGPTVGEWQKDADEESQQLLCRYSELLGISQTVPGHIHYQLLHRAATAVIEAQRFKAGEAMLLVHSFSLTDTGFAEFNDFLALFGAATEVNLPVTAPTATPIPLHLLWVQD